MAAAGIKDEGLRYNSFANLDTLLSGVLLRAGGPPIPRGSSGPRGRGGWWSWPAAWSSPPGRSAGGGRGTWRSDQVLIWAWALGVIVLASDPPDRWTAFLRRPTFVWLGRISYGLYMYHEDRHRSCHTYGGLAPLFLGP